MQDRSPRAPMTAADVVDSFERAGVAVWLDGGRGVDALLDETREHDLDEDDVGDLRALRERFGL